MPAGYRLDGIRRRPERRGPGGGIVTKLAGVGPLTGGSGTGDSVVGVMFGVLTRPGMTGTRRRRRRRLRRNIRPDVVLMR